MAYSEGIGVYLLRALDPPSGKLQVVPSTRCHGSQATTCLVHHVQTNLRFSWVSKISIPEIHACRRCIAERAKASRSDARPLPFLSIIILEQVGGPLGGEACRGRNGPVKSSTIVKSQFSVLLKSR